MYIYIYIYILVKFRGEKGRNVIFFINILNQFVFILFLCHKKISFNYHLFYFKFISNLYSFNFSVRSSFSKV